MFSLSLGNETLLNAHDLNIFKLVLIVVVIFGCFDSLIRNKYLENEHFMSIALQIYRKYVFELNDLRNAIV